MISTNMSVQAAICKISSAFVALGLLSSAIAAVPATKPAAFPLTTKSAEARHLVDQALVLYIDRVAQPEAIASLRKAIEIDSQFAMAHELLAQLSLDSAEQVAEQHAR